MRTPSVTFDLPLSLERLSPEEITWLAAKSGQTGKPVSQVARELIRAAAEKDGCARQIGSQNPTPPER